jgi:folate-binding protein YgfZ
LVDPIVSDVTQLDDDYHTLRQGAALAETSVRGQLAVSGRDRASYLQGLLTNDIQALTPGTGCYAMWLTPQGRITTDLHVLEAGDMILLDVPADLTQPILQRLDQFLFSEDVQLADISGVMTAVGVHGPRAEATLAKVATGISGEWMPYRNVRSEFDGGPVVVARIDQLGVPGFVIFVERARENDLRNALGAAGAARVGNDAVTAARIEAGYPIFGIDMDDDIIPLEAGVESRGVSFSKGCYVGQEVIIRVLHRGHGRVVRKLMGLRVEGEARPTRGARLRSGDRDIGFVTSAARSPALGTIALGYVHRDFLEAGTRIEVEIGDARVPATVSALPLSSGS